MSRGCKITLVVLTGGIAFWYLYGRNWPYYLIRWLDDNP